MRKTCIQEITADKFQYRITQEFQTFITSKFAKLFLVGIGAVCQCLFQKFLILKSISYDLFQFFHIISVLLFLLPVFLGLHNEAEEYARRFFHLFSAV